MGRIGKLVVSTLTVLFVLSLAPGAEAQGGRARKIDGVRFDVHLDLGWHQAFGVGFRADIPILPDGFIRRGRVTDELAISFGGEFFFWTFHGHDHDDGDHHNDLDQHDGVSLMPLAVAQWNLHVNEDWSFFPEVGAGFAWWTYEHDHGGGDHSHSSFRAYPVVSAGARWQFSDRNALLFRVSWPAGFQFGITF